MSLQHVELTRLLSTSSKGVSATTEVSSLDRFITVQGIAANHEQGRVNGLPGSKERRATRAYALLIAPKRIFLKKNFVKFLYQRESRFLRNKAASFRGE